MNSNVQSLWIGKVLTNNEIMSIRSYISNNYGFHLYVYEEICNLPNGVALKDANQILDRSKIFKDSHHTYASFADWFRVKLLYDKGGWWVDTDTVCIKPFNFRNDYCFSSERYFGGGLNNINNTYMKAPRGCAFLESMLNDIEGRLFNNEIIRWGEIGVYLIRQFIEDHPDFKQYIVPPDFLCPIDFFNMSDLICDSGFVLPKNARAVHLWNEIWRRGYLDKNAKYNTNSIYEELKRRYL